MTSQGDLHRPFPDVVLKDLEGNSWAADRFEHKTTIAFVWATWCGPCVSELPFFAKLAERFKDRTDVQVVSFNIDENRGLIEPFMSRNSYKFPVLLAQDYADRLMPWLSIPRTWIIRDGAIVEEEEGFGGSGEQWMNRIAAKVESR